MADMHLSQDSIETEGSRSSRGDALESTHKDLEEDEPSSDVSNGSWQEPLLDPFRLQHEESRLRGRRRDHFVRMDTTSPEDTADAKDVENDAILTDYDDSQNPAKKMSTATLLIVLSLVAANVSQCVSTSQLGVLALSDQTALLRIVIVCVCVASLFVLVCLMVALVARFPWRANLDVESDPKGLNLIVPLAAALLAANIIGLIIGAIHATEYKQNRSFTFR